MINIETGEPWNELRGMGAGSDSYYEYLLKLWLLGVRMRLRQYYFVVHTHFVVLKCTLIVSYHLLQCQRCVRCSITGVWACSSACSAWDVHGEGMRDWAKALTPNIGGLPKP